MKHGMPHEMNHNYYQIEQAIEFMARHHQMPVSVERLANAADIEVDDFQRIFEEWSGVDAETFSRKLSPKLTRREDSNAPDLFDRADSHQLSRTVQLHERFLNIIRMEPEDHQNGGVPLAINYSVQHSLFGRMMVASTGKGVCRVSFLSEEEECITILENEFPEAEIRQEDMPDHINLANYFRKEGIPEAKINLHVKGTPFQISVWEELLRIPEGDLRCCADIAKEIENPKALRAVGSAVGKNPVAFFIPCHRIVPAAGDFGNYRWGINRKVAMIGWEAVRAAKE